MPPIIDLRAGMIFLDAINLHVGWKVHLQAYLDGTLEEPLNPRAVGRDNDCELGRWLYDNLPQFQDLPEFWQLIEDHAAFHRCAAEIVYEADKGRRDEAERLLHHDYTDLSHRMVRGLRELGRQVGEG